MRLVSPEQTTTVTTTRQLSRRLAFRQPERIPSLGLGGSIFQINVSVPTRSYYPKTPSRSWVVLAGLHLRRGPARWVRVR